MITERIYGLILKVLPEAIIEELYFEAGRNFGMVVLDEFFCCKPGDFDKRYKKWRKLEIAYASKGLETISLEDFVDAAFGADYIANKLGIKIDDGEHPVLHSDKYYDKNSAILAAL